ncbi:GMC family oxidoreductase [Mycobacteroides abscessus]|uniref:GMC family oxidoreductase n=1 Tax=Mycobacteroides abscessus TaxID=36809 RepID=UPI0018965A8B|nr:GMC family oxidoreductase N-terminal domain-containing protein [Mycobacteroides abscessus]
MSRNNQFADYVVIGGGSAGCVAANRLSEDPNCLVMLIEAGGPDEVPQIHDVSMSSLFYIWGAAWGGDDTGIDWGYQSVPQKHLKQRQIVHLRGKVMGGSSAVNAMMWVRGNKLDYDRWEREGATGWSYADVLPYFEKLENFLGKPDPLRGVSGPTTVWPHQNLTALAEIFFDAADELGYVSESRDYNSAVQENFAFPYQVNLTPDGTRCSSAVSHIKPIAERANLSVRTRAHVTKLNIVSGVVKNIEYVSGGRRGVVNVGSGVVLSAGVFETPKLLMLSGIGPAAEMTRLGLPCDYDSPSMCGNLQDHPYSPLIYDSPVSHPSVNMVSEAGMFLRSSLIDATIPPDLQITFGTPTLYPVAFPEPDGHSGAGFTISPTIIQPKSRGTVRMVSTDPMANLEVDPNYLSDPADLAVIMEGVQICRDLTDTKALKAVRGEEIRPGRGTSEADLEDYIRSTLTTTFHPSGTCRMGGDGESVVDPTLLVRGAENVWVADGSVMPYLPTGNPNAAAMMIGARVADFIKDRLGESK